MRTKQQGVVLVISLIFLAVMTLLVLSMVRTSLLELKIGGVNQEAEAAFATAEVSISQYINENAGAFAPGCLTIDPSSGPVDLRRQSCRWWKRVPNDPSLGEYMDWPPPPGRPDYAITVSSLAINDRDVQVEITHPAAPSPVSYPGRGIQMPSGMNGTTLCQLPFNVRARVSDSSGIFSGDVVVNQGLHSFFAGTGSCS